jgi:hypothetical protein
LRRALLVVFAGLVLAGCGTSSPGGTGAGSLPLDSRSPLQQPGATMRVLVQFHRPSLAQAMATAPLSPGRQRAYVSNLHNEAIATQSSLRAKGIRLANPVLFARVWDGFAATIRSRDLPKLQALGLRAERVRRFFGAAAGTSAAVPRGGRTSRPVIALLDAARHGNAVEAVLAQGLGPARGRILRVRVGGPHLDPASGGTLEYATTDELLSGLERAVDPDGNGDVSDRLPVALVGVNAPYAGFEDSPEAEAVAGATDLGTLVVAPAGNDGPSAGRFGTVGSPAAASGAVAVGALEGGGAPALPSVELGLATSQGRLEVTAPLLGGTPRPRSAPIGALTGPTQAHPKLHGRELGGEPLEYFGVDAAPRARGRVVVVPARSPGGARTPALASRAAAASEAHAAALVVCEPDASRPLPALPEGTTSIPVIGLRGDAAQRALDLTPHDGGLAFISAPRPATDHSPLAPAPTSSRGPTYALSAKPDLAALGTATLGGRFVAGSSIAAARVAAVATRLRMAKPNEAPAETLARLAQTATPRGAVLAVGAGVPSLSRASADAVLATPATVALKRQDAGHAFKTSATLTLRNTGTATARLTPVATIRGVAMTVAPASLTLQPDATRTLTVTASGTRPAGFLTGTLKLGSGRVALSLPIGVPPAAVLSPLRVEAGRGVRFTAGAVSARGEAIAVAPVGDLTLEILDRRGSVVRELTPQGGARDLLPGEYAYTLTKDAAGALSGGPYRFRAIAHGTAGGPPAVRTSSSFRAR